MLLQIPARGSLVNHVQNVGGPSFPHPSPSHRLSIRPTRERSDRNSNVTGSVLYSILDTRSTMNMGKETFLVSRVSEEAAQLYVQMVSLLITPLLGLASSSSSHLIQELWLQRGETSEARGILNLTYQLTL